MALSVGRTGALNGKLAVANPMTRISADEPTSIQAGPSSIPVQGNRTQPLSNSIQGGLLNPGRTPIQNNNAIMPLQNTNSAVNAKGGLKTAISKRLPTKPLLTK